MTEQLKPCPCCGSLEATIKTMNVGTYRVFCGYCRLCIPGCESRSEAIEKWNTRADGWISVEDELPLDNGFVIARSIGITDSVHYTGTLILYFSKAHPKGQQFHSSSRITHVTCTHWMPLPKPPVKDLK